MSAYKESTVEDIDVVCLNSLARSGTCHCMNVSSFAITLLSRWVTYLHMYEIITYMKVFHTNFAAVFCCYILLLTDVIK